MKKNSAVKVGGVAIGGDNPVVIQSMTNTDTCDIDATVVQIEELVQAGSELVRCTVNNQEAAAAVISIKDRLARKNINVPLIGDFHFNGHKLLAENSECASVLDKYRINPGNVGSGDRHDRQFSQMIEIACKNDKPVRIGVNFGSLDQELLQKMVAANEQLSEPLSLHQVSKNAIIESALQSAAMAEDIGLGRDKIILSCKISNAPDLIDIYRNIAAKADYALHLGLTEAGAGIKGIVSSSTALAILLNEGIGDTIRVSLTPSPQGSRADEVFVAKEILQSLGLRAFAPSVTSCPGCGRTSNSRYLALADSVQAYINKRAVEWVKLNPASSRINIAVMGCVVNGPGESKHADIGISLPGRGEDEIAPVYINGEKSKVLKGSNIEAEFLEMLDEFVLGYRCF